MKKLCACLCMAFLLVGCNSGLAAKESATTADTVAYDLTARLMEQRQGGNLLFSPYSLQQMLPLIWDNTTQKRVQKELSPFLVPELRREQLANTLTGELILLDKKLAPLAKGRADGDVLMVSYPEEALREKEAFQEGILGSVIDSTPPQGNLTFLTAAHYYAEWATKFDKHLTKKRPFTGENGKALSVTTMKKHFTTGLGKITAQYELAAVPGKNGKSVVYFVKPKKELAEVTKALPQIVADFEAGKGVVRNIDLEVPKLMAKGKLDLNPLLKSMGLKSFYDGRLQFNKITGAVPYVLANASQTVTLDINEDYAEGKALTEIGFRTTSIGMEPRIYEIKMDSPYFIIIKDSNKAGIKRVVFTAYITQPE